MDVHVAGNESRHVKSQIHPTDAFRVGRPAEPAVADATQPAIGSVEEARGGAARPPNRPPWPPLSQIIGLPRLQVGADTAIKTPFGRVYSERQRN